MERKTGITSTITNSRNYLQNSIPPTILWYYVPKHRFLAERTRYYSNSYSIISYRIPWFLMRMLWCYPPTPHPPTPTFRSNYMDVVHPLMYVTHLAAARENSPSHATTKRVTNSYTSLGKPSPRQLYAGNPSSSRSAAYQIWKYVMVVIYFRQGMTY